MDKVKPEVLISLLLTVKPRQNMSIREYVEYAITELNKFLAAREQLTSRIVANKVREAVT